MTDLKTLALAATPGPWIAAGPSFGAPLPITLDSVVQDSNEEGEGFSICRDVDDPDDAAYIAAASPDAILKMLEDLDQYKVDFNEELILRRNAEAERDRLREALEFALESIESWGCYATEYFRQKHNLDGDLKRVRQALEEAR